MENMASRSAWRISVPLAMAECHRREVDDLSGDGVRGIEVLDVEGAGVGEWSVGFVLGDDLAGDGGS